MESPVTRLVLLTMAISVQKTCASFQSVWSHMNAKAELLLLKLIHLFAREVLLVKKLEIEETKTT